MIAHSAVEVAAAADRLAVGTMADFSRAMTALASGDLDGASARVDFVPVVATSRDEVGEMARSFNTLQHEIAKAAIGLTGAREGLRRARDELTETNVNLELRVVARTGELEAAHRKLVVAARRAGMAEVAIGVLHNIGNVLNSVNISVALVDQMLRASQGKAKNLTKLAELLDDADSELGRAARQDPRGRQVVDYLRKYSRQTELERDEVLTELDSLIKSVEHIKQIVNSQQALASGASLTEPFDLLELTDEAIRINQTQIDEHRVEIVRRFTPLPIAIADKHLLLQVLVNLISNAIRAVSESTDLRAIAITLDLDPADPAQARWQIDDTGVGIAADHMLRIFESGFTTKPTGQGGFGLHNSALSIERMAGSLRAFSDGLGKGARFLLVVPLHAVPASEPASVAS
jgi:signal transduction histidine kinase